MKYDLSFVLPKWLGRRSWFIVVLCRVPKGYLIGYPNTPADLLQKIFTSWWWWAYFCFSRDENWNRIGITQWRGRWSWIIIVLDCVLKGYPNPPSENFIKFIHLIQSIGSTNHISFQLKHLISLFKKETFLRKFDRWSGVHCQVPFRYTINHHYESSPAVHLFGKYQSYFISAETFNQPFWKRNFLRKLGRGSGVQS